MLCAEEGNTTEPNSSRYTVRLADIKPKVTPCEYRLVVFTAKKHYMHHLHNVEDINSLIGLVK